MKKLLVIAAIAFGIFLAMPNVKISIQQPQAAACNMSSGAGCD